MFPRSFLTVPATLLGCIGLLTGLGCKPKEQIVSGQVFIVTQRGDSVKMGGVHVHLYDRKAATTVLEERRKLQEKTAMELEPKLKAAVSSAQSASNVFKKPRTQNGEAEWAMEKVNQMNDIRTQVEAVLDPSFLTQGLPSPVASGITDADGRFSISAAGGKPLMVGATAKRSIGGKTETTAWLTDVVSTPVILTNDNQLAYQP